MILNIFKNMLRKNKWKNICQLVGGKNMGNFFSCLFNQ